MTSYDLYVTKVACPQETRGLQFVHLSSKRHLKKDTHRIIALSAVFSFQRQKPIKMKQSGPTVMREGSG